MNVQDADGDTPLHLAIGGRIEGYGKVSLLGSLSVSQRTSHLCCCFVFGLLGKETITVLCTLRASLSGSSLQTLPDLVTPLKGYSLSPRSCPAKGSGTDKTVEVT